MYIYIYIVYYVMYTCAVLGGDDEISERAHLYIYTALYVCMYIHMFIYVYVYIYIYV
jgi:hypothetical protein